MGHNPSINSVGINLKSPKMIITRTHHVRTGLMSLVQNHTTSCTVGYCIFASIALLKTCALTGAACTFLGDTSRKWISPERVEKVGANFSISSAKWHKVG